MIERHGNLVLLVGAVALIAGGLASGATEARIGLCALGAALAVLAVVLSRTEGRLKVGPSGIEAELGPLRREAIAQSEAIGRSLNSRNLDLVSLATGALSLEDVPDPEQVTNAVASLLETVNRIDEASQGRGDVVPAEVLLETARGLMASGDWSGAAAYLDRYVEERPSDWEAQFARGVAHANARVGPESDVAALAAYNGAIAFRPADLDPNMVARMHAYRGAMLKRRGRLEEAESDLLLAQRLATDSYEKADVAYNLACVYAMRNRRDQAIPLIRSLRGTQYIDAIRANRDRYFGALRGDPEFEALLDEPIRQR